MMKFKTGASIASAAALLALSGVASAGHAASHHGRAAAAAVHCYGVNSCRGQSDCRSGTHDCRGQNDCRGQGFKELTARACSAQHGSLTAPAPAAH